ncbi:hypothetical protein ACFOU2_00190 [Bacillus songklensis]|uniref:Spore coat protein n=1 Tax=Bacillus songklensis TaxID=1069116 RepID=A0ABV8AYL7_9BACI
MNPNENMNSYENVNPDTRDYMHHHYGTAYMPCPYCGSPMGYVHPSYGMAYHHHHHYGHHGYHHPHITQKQSVFIKQPHMEDIFIKQPHKQPHMENVMYKHKHN